MTPKEIEEHIVVTYDKILEIVNEMKNRKDIEFNYYFTLSSDLLCRVGELESSLKYWVDKRKDVNAEPTTNRLCTCYDTGEAENARYDEDCTDDYYEDYNRCICNCCNH